MVNTDTIIGWIKEQVEQKRPLSPEVWLNAAAKLTALMGDETDKQFLLEQKVAMMKKELLEDPKMPVSKAVVVIEASDEFLQARKQKARVEQIFEFIRITKKMATMKDTEMNI